MGTPTLTKNFIAEAAVAARRIVKFGTADGQVVQAAAATDAGFGVADLAQTTTGGRVDVHVAGIADVDFGGTVTRGGLVTADASGKAVAAAPGAGVNNRVIGIALAGAVAGDIAPVLLQPGQIQG